jgi:hypothetical protein
MASANNANVDLNCLTIAELESIAHDKMDKQTRDYYNEGADSGSTLRDTAFAPVSCAMSPPSTPAFAYSGTKIASPSAWHPQQCNA